MHPRAAAVLAACAAVALSSACASSGARPRPFPNPSAPAAPGRPAERPPAPPPSAPFPSSGVLDGYAIAHTALSYRGIPYRLGGTSPSEGFDCSGLVYYVFAQHGITLPRVVRDQYEVGEEVDLDDLEPGDLVFFETDGDDVSHVGIAIGGDQFVHAPNSRGEVRTSALSSEYWGHRALGARRVHSNAQN